SRDWSSDVCSSDLYPGDVEGVVCVGACVRLRGRRACGQCAGGHGASGADRGRSAVRTAFTMDTSRTRPELWRLLLLSVLPSTCNQRPGLSGQIERNERK